MPSGMLVQMLGPLLDHRYVPSTCATIWLASLDHLGILLDLIALLHHKFDHALRVRDAIMKDRCVTSAGRRPTARAGAPSASQPP